MIAAQVKADGVAKLLILAGADMNASDDEGQSPLWHAIRSADPHVCALLLSHGASRAEVRSRGAPPPYPPGARPLHAFLMGDASRGWGPLHFAAAAGEPHFLTAAMRVGMDDGSGACRSALEARPWEPWADLLRRIGSSPAPGAVAAGRAEEVAAMLRCGAWGPSFPALPSRTLEATRPPEDLAALLRAWPLCVRRAAGAALTCLRASAPGGSAHETALGRVFQGGHEDAWRHMLAFAMDWGDVGMTPDVDREQEEERPRKRRRGSGGAR